MEKSPLLTTVDAEAEFIWTVRDQIREMLKNKDVVGINPNELALGVDGVLVNVEMEITYIDGVKQIGSALRTKSTFWERVVWLVGGSGL